MKTLQVYDDNPKTKANDGKRFFIRKPNGVVASHPHFACVSSRSYTDCTGKWWFEGEPAIFATGLMMSDSGNNARTESDLVVDDGERVQIGSYTAIIHAPRFCDEGRITDIQPVEGSAVDGAEKVPEEPDNFTEYYRAVDAYDRAIRS